MEGMERDINQLKLTNQQLSDKLRVKEKMCDDHSDTIQKLKQVCNNLLAVENFDELDMFNYKKLTNSLHSQLQGSHYNYGHLGSNKIVKVP